MTTAEMFPLRVPGDVVDPLGVRELLDDRLFVGPVAFDLATRSLRTLELAMDSARFGCTLVIVDPAPAGIDLPIAAKPCRLDIAVAMRLRPTPGNAGDRRSVIVDDALRTLARHGLETFDTVLLDGVDPFVHPAVVADAMWALIERGLAQSVAIADHTVGQARAFIEHMGPGNRPVAVGVDLPTLSAPALTAGGLDLCMELGSMPLVGLRDDMSYASDPARLSALLHHPSRPVVVVQPDDLVVRMAAVEAARRPLEAGEIRTLLDDPVDPAPPGGCPPAT